MDNIGLELVDAYSVSIPHNVEVIRKEYNIDNCVRHCTKHPQIIGGN